jgi:hypothetical protein
MKRQILFAAFLIVVLLVISCAPNGELVTPPEGLEQAVKQQLAGMPPGTLEFTMTGMSVRAYPNDVYYVIADVTVTRKPNSPLSNSNDGNFPVKRSRSFIAQKGFQGTQPYWQVAEADKDKMRVLGIKSE